MNDARILSEDQPARSLAPALLDTIRTARDLQTQLVDTRECLHVAVTLLRDRDREIDRLRDENRFLRSQLRAAVSGRTISEELADLRASADDRQEAA